MKSGLFLVLSAVLVLACDKVEQAGSTETGAAAYQGSGIDKRDKPGRIFMYLDDDKNVVKTSSYEDIPVGKRQGVLVMEGKKRSRVRRGADGKIQIVALPPVVSASNEEKAGAASAAGILEKHPPVETGPPSTEKWTDDQWREELQRELAELKKEQEKEGPPEETP